MCFSVLLRLPCVLTGRAGSVSWPFRLRPRWADGGGMADSSNVVLLPSTAEFCSTLASSMMVWSEGETGTNCKHEENLTWAKYSDGSTALTEC